MEVARRGRQINETRRYIQSDSDLEIGKVVGQVTWNILLKAVPGGETFVWDRPWQGKVDDEKFQKARPRYTYSPLVHQGRVPKIVEPIVGDIAFFNSRYEIPHSTHECDDIELTRRAWLRKEIFMK